MSSTESQPFTLRSLLGGAASPPPPQESVLVVIDAQREYSSTGLLSLPDVDRAGENIARLIANARQADAPIVHVAHHGTPGMPFAPEAGGRFLDFAEPEGDEEVVLKTLPNAFADTELLSVVEGIGSSKLVILGFMTHMCVSSTARAALDLGFDTTVVADATATRSLPSLEGGDPMSAADVHAFALSALADRFSLVTQTGIALEANAN